MEVMDKKKGETTDYLTWRRKKDVALRRLDGGDGLDESLLLMTLVTSFFAYVRALMMMRSEKFFF